MKASVEAYMDDMEGMKASKEVTSMGACTNAFTKSSTEVTSTKASMKNFIDLMELFVEVMEALIEVTRKC